MLKADMHLVALVAIFILALALKLIFVTQEPLIYHADAGYYVEHVGEVLTQGYPDVKEPPLSFYYAGFFAAFLGVMLGFKVAISIASAAIAFPVYKITEQLGKKKDVALLAAFLAAFAPANMFLMGSLLKNVVGLFFGAWFVYFLIKTTDRFTMRDAVFAAISGVLMLGSHLSSSGYIIFTIAPFLVLLPVYEFWKERMLSKGSLLIFIAGVIALSYLDINVSRGNIGSIGIQEGKGLGFDLIGEYLIFMPLVLLGLYNLKREHLLLFLPWLLITFLLTQPFLTEPGWEKRFIWNSYFIVAVLTALGAGALSSKRILFYGLAFILGAYTLAGFVYEGQSMGPIISEEEWHGLLALHKQRPDITFSMVEGGTAQWVEAAGFNTTLAPMPGTYLLLCDRSEPNLDKWLDGGCLMTVFVEKHTIEQSEPIAKFGRFYVVPIGQVPLEQDGDSQASTHDGGVEITDDMK
jgi:hypothetical protein